MLRLGRMPTPPELRTETISSSLSSRKEIRDTSLYPSAGLDAAAIGRVVSQKASFARVIRHQLPDERPGQRPAKDRPTYGKARASTTTEQEKALIVQLFAVLQ